MRAGGERVYVALGANLGDREATFSAAIAALEREPDLRLVAASGVYETPPLGPPGQAPYLNAVVALHDSVRLQAECPVLDSVRRSLEPS